MAFDPTSLANSIRFLVHLTFPFSGFSTTQSRDLEECIKRICNEAISAYEDNVKKVASHAPQA